MKVAVLVAGLACALALPASAQSFPDPASIAQKAYVEVEGGGTIQGAIINGVSGVGLGTSHSSTRLRNDFIGGGLVGFTLVRGISLEAEGIYTRVQYRYPTPEPIFGTAGRMQTYGGLGNLKLSLPLTTHFRRFGVQPYVAGGVGYGHVEFRGSNGAFAYRDREDGFMWQGKAGLEFDLGRHLAFDLAYRYLQSPDYETPGAYHGVNYSALARSHVQAVTLGAKFNF